MSSAPLDVGLLTRLANELFRAGPSTEVASALASPASVAGATSAASLPSPVGVEGIDFTSVPSQPTSIPAPAGVPRPGSLPGGASLPSASATPPVRSLSGHPSPTNIPAEVDLRELLEPRALLGVAGVPASSSTLPGAGAAVEDATFYFLAYATPASKPVAPVPDPWSSPVPRAHVGQPPFDLNRVRRDFPILEERVHGRRLVWLDNAATTQKPRQVIERITQYYEHENSNIHRAAHELAARATDAYEGAREKVRAFLGAKSKNEIVFVRGATEAINLVAQSFGRSKLSAGDEIVLSHLEHHANIVPWQQVAAATGAQLRVIPVDDDGQVLLEEYGRLLGPKTKIVAFTQVSNALGTITPAKRMVEMAHAAGATVLVDGAQSVSHMPIDVHDLGADFFVFSGHKVFAPTGIGVLYGREELLNAMPPWQGGGNMIRDVTFERSLYHSAPGRFEAGTGNIADAVGLGAAIDYITSLGMHNIAAYEHALLGYATKRMAEVPGLRLVGTAPDKASVLSFVLAGFDNLEVGQALDQDGIAVRAGHHCAQPILRRFGLESTVRPSLAFYNTCADVDALIASLLRIVAARRRIS